MATLTLTNSFGHQIAKVSQFHDGDTHTVQGYPVAQGVSLRNEQEVIRYAKDNNLTIKFGR